MILEHAILNVKPGQGAAFEQALKDALPLMTATPGFVDIEVRRCLETPDRYVLLVHWDSLEAHTEGFRGSDRYKTWRHKLHHFYEPFPAVEHYGEPIVTG
ncbi:MAG: antibiotic biosynthesis monooxygenase [Alphaproteobacteria bacterium]|nr:antibiotic biosynthesis monooxygenase [Alphaproteobacteria bacterium]